MSLRHAWDANLTAVLLDQGLAAPLIADSPALRRRLRACMRGSGSNTPQLSLLVLGASMASGNMNCAGNCTGDRQQPLLAWPAMLEAHLRAGLGCGAKVTVHAFGGWTSEMAAHKLHRILHGRADLPDLLLLEASVNDAAVSNWGKGPGLTQCFACTAGPAQTNHGLFVAGLGRTHSAAQPDAGAFASPAAHCVPPPELCRTVWPAGKASARRQYLLAAVESMVRRSDCMHDATYSPASMHAVAIEHVAHMLVHHACDCRVHACAGLRRGQCPPCWWTWRRGGPGHPCAASRPMPMPTLRPPTCRRSTRRSVATGGCLTSACSRRA